MLELRLIALALSAAGILGGWLWLKHSLKQAGYQECRAEQVEADRIASKARAARDASAAVSIGSIKAGTAKARIEVQHEIETRVVYADCRHSDEQLRNINAAITGSRAEPSGGGLMPRTDAAGRAYLRGNDAQADRDSRPVP